MINTEINRLINFGIQNEMIQNEDRVYISNKLMEILKLQDFHFENVVENLETANPILQNIVDFAIKNHIIENSQYEKEKFSDKLMDFLMDKPSQIIEKFWQKYESNKEDATNYFYNLSQKSNYIKVDAIKKNIIFKVDTDFGKLDITINLSKPEKDPKDIIKAKSQKPNNYPKCLLCKENEGYEGSINHPSRYNHRMIPLEINKNKWFMQYSPYIYYNEHCILLNEKHIPMKINKDTLLNIINFVEIFPHYFLGSNADLPIVGGSILSHDHYQGGRYDFPIVFAPIEKVYKSKKYKDVKISRVKWPMSTIRLNSTNKNELIDFAYDIFKAWQNYSDESVDIISHSKDEAHNTITPIARINKDGEYELDIVLRNNRCTEEYPLGIFHPHNEVHHIKKENIGLIEVMGLAVLPGRLKNSLEKIKNHLLSADFNFSEDILIHKDWIFKIKGKYPEINIENVDDILRNEIGYVFLEVLTHAGVFKRDEKGLAAFDKFMKTVSI